MARAGIEVKGLERTLNALSVIDPEAMKALRSGFRDVAKPILDDAKSLVPAKGIASSRRAGWGAWNYDGRDLSFDAAKVKRGLTTSVRANKRYAVLRLMSKDAAGAIYENAGSKSLTPFTKMIAAQSGKEAPRLLVYTWKHQKGIKQTYKAVWKLIRDAEARVQRAVD